MENLVRLAEQGFFRSATYPTKEAYLEETAAFLIGAGAAKEGFATALIEREKNFPTGLETVSIPVSIPHADITYVEKEMIVVTRFEHPISFQRMDDPEQTVEVELSIMLLLKEAHNQLEALRDLSDLFQSEVLREMAHIHSMNEFIQLLKEVNL